jgi:hypothetical protein
MIQSCDDIGTVPLREHHDGDIHDPERKVVLLLGEFCDPLPLRVQDRLDNHLSVGNGGIGWATLTDGEETQVARRSGRSHVLLDGFPGDVGDRDSPAPRSHPNPGNEVLRQHDRRSLHEVTVQPHAS